MARMQPRVTAILVARHGAATIERTLDALVHSTRRPDTLIFVDDASSDDSAALASRFAPSGSVRLEVSRPFGSAVAHALHVVAPPGEDDEWLWLLGHDNAPEPGALAALVAAVEVAPSVAVAGPKLMRADAPDVIADFGATLSYYGATVRLVDGELDQAQYDRVSDLLAVRGAGMLVRRTVWEELGGFDPGLPSIDAALDFCVRVRLAGHRIVGVPGARVASASAPEQFLRPSSPGHTARVARSAQLHRRMTWASAAALPWHWLALLPLAVIRSIGHLVGKRPERIAAEFRAAFLALVDGSVAPARRNLARSRRLGWRAIAALRMPPRDVRRLRAHQRDLASSPVLDTTLRVRASFFAAGGAWIVLGLLLVGVLSAAPLLGAAALAGGGLAPLSTSVGELWSHVGYGWHTIGTENGGAGFVGASDPFAALLAVLGSLTFWDPSSSVVVLYVIAIPLAGLGGWWAASRFSARGWAPAVGAIAWGLAPPLLSALSTGHLGAIISHLLLPWLVLALVGARHSWAAAATASILSAGIAASSPSLLPLLVIAWLLTAVSGTGRAWTIPVPTVLLFLPLVVEQASRGQWLALLADPGVPVASGTASGWQLALGSPDAGSSGWVAVATALGLPPVAGSLAVAVLLVPVLVLALIGVVRERNGRTVLALVLAAAGYAAAVACAHVSVAAAGADAVELWPGAALSVMWLGLAGAACFAVDRARVLRAAPVLIASVAIAVLAVPAVAAGLLGDRDVAPSDGRLLPAYVSAEVSADPDLATLLLTPRDDGSLVARVERGTGTTLDEQSTVVATDHADAPGRAALAELAANITSRTGLDLHAALSSWGIGFVLVTGSAHGDGLLTTTRASQALDANPLLEAVGTTSGGDLWHVVGSHGVPAPALSGAASLTATLVRTGLLVTFVIALLVAIPTTRRRRVTTALTDEERATTFDTDETDD